MVRLKDRTRQVPNGFRFLQPETGFEPQAWSSFDSMVQQILNHRQGNSWLAQKHNWNLTVAGIGEELDFYNSKVCQAQGWSAYITEDNDSPPDFRNPSLLRPSEGAVIAEGGSKVKKAVSGLKLFRDWLGSGLKPVEQSLANKRADICAVCPQNVLGDFWQRLEGIAASEIRTLIAIKSDLELKLVNEDRLNSCAICDCWLPLKTFSPLNHVLENTSPEVMAAFPEHCWVKRRDA